MKLKKAKKSKAKAAAAEENGEVTGKKKGGKKKLLLIPIALVLVAGIAAAAIFVVLPKFGINLLGDSSEDPLEEPLPKKGVEAYVIGEDNVPSLDTILEEGDGALIALRSPGRYFTGDTSGTEERYTYIYELNSFADVMDRYLDVVMGSEYGLYITDENYVVREERPELQDAEGALILARNVTVPEGEEPGGSEVFQLVVGWSEASANLAVRVSTAAGTISFPKKEEEGGGASVAEPSSVSLQMEQLRNMSPAHLGLSGDSMDNYTIFPVDGFVKVNDQDCRRFNIYEKNNPGTIAGTYFFSVDQEHIYVLNPSDNKVHTIK